MATTELAAGDITGASMILGLDAHDADAVGGSTVHTAAGSISDAELVSRFSDILQQARFVRDVYFRPQDAGRRVAEEQRQVIQESYFELMLNIHNVCHLMERKEGVEAPDDSDASSFITRAGSASSASSTPLLSSAQHAQLQTPSAQQSHAQPQQSSPTRGPGTAGGINLGAAVAAARAQSAGSMDSGGSSFSSGTGGGSFGMQSGMNPGLLAMQGSAAAAAAAAGAGAVGSSYNLAPPLRRPSLLSTSGPNGPQLAARRGSLDANSLILALGARNNNGAGPSPGVGGGGANGGGGSGLSPLGPSAGLYSVIGSSSASGNSSSNGSASASGSGSNSSPTRAEAHAASETAPQPPPFLKHAGRSHTTGSLLTPPPPSASLSHATSTTTTASRAESCRSGAAGGAISMAPPLPIATASVVQFQAPGGGNGNGNGSDANSEPSLMQRSLLKKLSRDVLPATPEEEDDYQADYGGYGYY